MTRILGTVADKDSSQDIRLACLASRRSRGQWGFVIGCGRALTEAVPSTLFGDSFAQNDTGEGGGQDAARPGRVATVRDLVRSAPYSACQEENLEQLNFCWKCGVQPVRSWPAPRYLQRPRSWLMSNKSSRAGTKYWRLWKGARGNYGKAGSPTSLTPFPSPSQQGLAAGRLPLQTCV